MAYLVRPDGHVSVAASVGAVAAIERMLDAFRIVPAGEPAEAVQAGEAADGVSC